MPNWFDSWIEDNLPGVSGETVDPVITVISQPIISTDPLIVTLYDVTSTFAMYEITCQDRSDGKRLTVYSSIDGFVHPFSGKSTVRGTGTSGNPYTFTIYRRGRWPTGIDLDVRIQAVDAVGNEVND